MSPRVGRSLQSQVARTGVLLLGLWVAVITLAVNLVVSARLDAQADDELRTRAQAAATTVEVRGGQVVTRETTRDATLDVGTFIVATGGRVLEAPRAGAAVRAQAARFATGRRGFRSSDIPGHAFDVRWYVQPVLSGDRRVATVVTYESLKPYRTTQALTLAGTVALALLLLLAAWLALRAGVGRALRPVSEMTHQAARWSTDDVDRRFGEAGRPRELEDLAVTLDGVLDRIAAVLRHERRVSAEISHELRTPTARVLAEVELLRSRDRDRGSTEEALATIERSAQEMTAILETLLAAARAEDAAVPGRCDAVAAVRAAVDGREPGRLPVTVTGDEPAMVGVDAALLTRTVSPLLDNAQRYGRSRIDVRLSRSRGTVVVEVSDDGPGFAADVLPHAFEPGRRAAAPDGHQGAGLGLALVRRLVTSAGGSVGARNDGGAVVELRLPAA